MYRMHVNIAKFILIVNINNISPKLVLDLKLKVKWLKSHVYLYNI